MELVTIATLAMVFLFVASITAGVAVARLSGLVSVICVVDLGASVSFHLPAVSPTLVVVYIFSPTLRASKVILSSPCAMNEVSAPRSTSTPPTTPSSTRRSRAS